MVDVAAAAALTASSTLTPAAVDTQLRTLWGVGSLSDVPGALGSPVSSWTKLGCASTGPGQLVTMINNVGGSTANVISDMVIPDWRTILRVPVRIYGSADYMTIGWMSGEVAPPSSAVRLETVPSFFGVRINIYYSGNGYCVAPVYGGVWQTGVKVPIANPYFSTSSGPSEVVWVGASDNHDGTARLWISRQNGTQPLGLWPSVPRPFYDLSRVIIDAGTGGQSAFFSVEGPIMWNNPYGTPRRTHRFNPDRAYRRQAGLARAVR